MLKKWIEQIKKSPEHYGVKYWKYSYSNNMLELSVNKDYQQDETDYRKAIVSIGRVLYTLRQNFTKSGMQNHIQIFPNFDDSALIAAIRTFSPSSAETKKTTEEQPDCSDAGLILDGLKNYAIANQLHLDQLTSSDMNILQVPKTNENVAWFALCADHENPYTWLRVGYWSEYLFSLKSKYQNCILVIEDSEKINTRVLPKSNANKRFVQLVVGLSQS